MSTDELHVGKPNIGDRDLFYRMLDNILDSGRLTNDGPMVKTLESIFCDIVEVEHAIAVSNATRGIEIATRALNMDREVLMPSFTFIATPNALTWQRATPKFVDTLPNDYTIDPSEVERAIGKRTSGIVAVHTFGKLCQARELRKIAGAYELPIVYDAAHALGCPGAARHGNASVFSLHATKVANSFEGGVITTNDPDLADTCRLMRNFGIVGYGETATLGINAKMSEVHAAMGIVSLISLDEWIEHNMWVWGQYRMRLGDIVKPTGENYHYVVIEVENAEGLTHHLHKRNILARRYFHPGCHHQLPYSALDPDLALKNTEELCERVVCLPTGTSIGMEEVERVSLEVEAYLKGWGNA